MHFTIRSQDLHEGDIRKVVGEIASYREWDYFIYF
jgi:hypothetical protein